jgi:hypothetical protein
MEEIIVTRFSESKLRGYCHVKNRSVSKKSRVFQRMMDSLSSEREPSKSNVLIELALIIVLSVFTAIALDYILS